MNLDEAIIHAKEVADRCSVTDGDRRCEREHRQLAEWLKELKAKRKQVEILARNLDGCPLEHPCDKMWEPEGWCQEHCKPQQDAPDMECWLRYAEVMANE